MMLRKSFLQYIKQNQLFTDSDTVLLAVSSGIDSVVMAHLFKHHFPGRFAIAHCNFQLRGRESDLDAGFAQRLASDFQVPFFLTVFATSTAAATTGTSIQMAARKLRYEWFEKVRSENGYSHIATAHHLDDQVETFIVNLIRGTGIAGLHGIPIRNKHIIRPMLFASRQQIDSFANQHRIEYRTDQSNHDNKYVRNKIRHDIIPLMSSINPGFKHRLTRSISYITQYEIISKEIIRTWLTMHLIVSDSEISIAIKMLRELPSPEPYLWEFLSEYGFNETQVGNLVSGLYDDTIQEFFSTTHRLIKQRELLTLIKNESSSDQEIRLPKFNDYLEVNHPVDLRFTHHRNSSEFIIPTNPNLAVIDVSSLTFPLILRRWHQGDYFFPLGMQNRKKLSDFFIDQKFTVLQKENTWLLCSGRDIVWIIGHRLDNRFKVTKNTTEILMAEFVTSLQSPIG